MSLTVACVFKESQTYKRSHVDRLEHMVYLNMNQPYKFVCVDDSPYPGFWSKISLFQPGRFKDRVLYIDLDSTVIDNLDDLADFPEPFVIIENFKEIREHNKAKFNSSVMAWYAGSCDTLFTEFNTSVITRLNGDQDWISEQIPNAATFPKDWCVSYRVRRYAKFKSLPLDTRVISYNGKPKPWELPDNDLDGFTITC